MFEEVSTRVKSTEMHLQACLHLSSLEHMLHDPKRKLVNSPEERPKVLVCLV
jgi:hypothetical protein